MFRYSHEQCLQRSYQVNWRLEEVLDGRRFDPAHEWLPRSLSAMGSNVLSDPGERRRLPHIEMASHAHLFGHAEEFVAPTVVELAREAEGTDRSAFDALTNFAAEEVKHMALFRRLRDQIDEPARFRPRAAGRTGGDHTLRAGQAPGRRAVAHRLHRVVHPAPLPRVLRGQRAARPLHTARLPLPLARGVPARPDGPPRDRAAI